MRTVEAHGVFIGIVEDNNDPAKRNRLKIRVPDIYGTLEGGIATSMLPWAVPSMGTIISPPPAIGTMMCVSFKHGEIEFPVYSGYLIPQVSNKCSQCQHQFRAKCCKAFPSGIPNEIYSDKISHLTILPNQNGRYVFTKR